MTTPIDLNQLFTKEYLQAREEGHTMHLSHQLRLQLRFKDVALPNDH
jgi:hypothetical protein